MKDASGELNLTVITLVAIGLVIAFFTTIMWPRIQGSINSQWNGISTGTGKAAAIIVKR